MKAGFVAVMVAVLGLGTTSSALAQGNFDADVAAKLVEVQDFAKELALAPNAAMQHQSCGKFLAISNASDSLFNQVLANPGLEQTQAGDHAAQIMEALNIIQQRYGC